MSVAALTKDIAENRLQNKLGAGRRCLELIQNDGAYDPSQPAADHYGEAICSALDLINQYVSDTQFEALNDLNDVQHNIDYSADKKLLQVINVTFLRPLDVVRYGEISVFGLTERALLARPYGNSYSRGGRPISSSNLLELQTQRYELEKVRGTEADWLFDRHNKILSLYAPHAPYSVTIDKAYPYELGNLPQSYHHQFFKAAEGFIRITLADVIGRWGGTFPGPNGSIENDANRQFDRGTVLVEQVEQWLQRHPHQYGAEIN